MSQLSHSFVLPVAEFNVALLPPSARGAVGLGLADAIAEYFKAAFKGFAGWAEINASAESVTIRWGRSADDPELYQQVIGKLQAGSHNECIPILELLAKKSPEEGEIFYNLGMALSDMGRLDEAITALQRACVLDSSDVNALVALGVAYARSGQRETAIEVLETVLLKDPDNPWAARNLASQYMGIGEHEKALPLLEKAVELMPDDQQSLFGLAHCKEAMGDLKSADEFYKMAIEADSFSEIGSLAKEARSALASRTFAKTGAGMGRPDAMMYCLAALELFGKMPSAKTREISFEIAMLGRGGLDLNDPAPKYKLRSLDGAFSALQLLAYMFVGFKAIAPNEDISFDLSKEYAMAKQLFDAKKG